MCTCGTEVETTKHFLLRCNFYSTQRFKLSSLSAKNRVHILLYVLKQIIPSLNQEILKNVISYLKATTRFAGPLINF